MRRMIVVFAALALFAVTATAQVLTGNGAPKGPHYNLNIIGVYKDKAADMTASQGHTIFVRLGGRSKILLTEGEFEVLDRNGTDGDGALFSLPNPDPDNDGVTVYSVFARALGKPEGEATITACATDPSAVEEVCSTYNQIQLKRSKGGQKFQNVTQNLLYVYADLDGDGTLERYALFSDDLVDYFWDYDNQGLKLAQLRFYEIETDIR